MTTEEKAKAFDEALERAKKLKETCDNTTVVGWMEYIFQELAEEEKTRKDLLNFLQSPFMKENIADWKVAPWIDWLEKQELTQSVTKISDKDWNEVRIQAAIAAMQGLISHQKGYIEAIRFSREIGIDTGNILACTAVEYADALIKKLKGE